MSASAGNGLGVEVKYGGSLSAPVNAGTYPVVATITADNYQGSVSNNLVVSRAMAVIHALPTVGSISFGHRLEMAILTGGDASPSGGRFAFTEPLFAPLRGTSAQGLRYTPPDAYTNNYVPGVTSVDVEVLKAQAGLDFVLETLSQTYTGVARRAQVDSSPSSLKVELQSRR